MYDVHGLFLYFDTAGVLEAAESFDTPVLLDGQVLTGVATAEVMDQLARRGIEGREDRDGAAFSDFELFAPLGQVESVLVRRAR